MRSFTKLSLVWHEAKDIWYPVKIELTDGGLLTPLFWKSLSNLQLIIITVC